MIILCLEIFSARIIDVSLGTVKTYFMIKNQKLLTTILAFFEVFIWFLVVRKALEYALDNILIPIFYAGGYAAGTYIGMLISSFVTHEIETLIVIAPKESKLDTLLKDKGYGVSVINMDSKDKYLLFITTSNKKTNILRRFIQSTDASSFITILNIKNAYGGYIK